MLMLVDLARWQLMEYYTWRPTRQLYRAARLAPYLASRLGLGVRQLFRRGPQAPNILSAAKARHAASVLFKDDYSDYAATLCRYRPEPYAGRICLVLSEEAYGFEGKNPQKRWRDLALGGVEVRVFPGTHSSRYDVHLPDMAEQIRSCLLAAQTRARSRPATGPAVGS